MAERQLPGKAHHDVPGLPGIGEVEDQDEDGEQIIVGEQRREQKSQKQRQQQDARAPRHALKKAHHVAALPNRPCGRRNRIRINSANENMLFAEGVKNNPASASVTPIRTPPNNAPGMEPNPPVITMTKASSVMAGPSAGVTSTISTRMEPAAPTQAAPSPKVSAYSRFTLRPTTSAPV